MLSACKLDGIRIALFLLLCQHFEYDLLDFGREPGVEVTQWWGVLMKVSLSGLMFPLSKGCLPGKKLIGYYPQAVEITTICGLPSEMFWSHIRWCASIA